MDTRKIQGEVKCYGTVASISSRNKVLQLQEVGDFTTNFHLKTASQIKDKLSCKAQTANFF